MEPVSAPSIGPSVGIGIPVDSFVALGFLFMVIIYVVFSVILHYHWKTYSTDAAVMRVTLIAYFSVSLTLLFIMGLTTLALY